MSHAQPQQHYLTLDAARGIAALAVMFYHIHKYIFPQVSLEPFSSLLKSSYLAVDLFFLMSGLVIARAYEARLRSGRMDFGAFCLTRLIRLWPLYATGTLMGFAYKLSQAILKPDATPIPTGTALLTLTQNAAFLPDFTNALEGMFPFNPAAWSLALEWFINLLYAAIAMRLSLLPLSFLASFCAVMLASSAWQNGNVDLGWSFGTAIGGIWRIGFSFTLGVIIFRLLEAKKLKAPRIPAPLLLAALTLYLITPWENLGESTWAATTYELLGVFIIFPAFVILGCHTHPKAKAQPVFWQLGRLSYAIYILHTPLILLFCGAWKFLLKTDPTLVPAQSALPLLLCIFATCALLTTLDERVRGRITAHLKKPKHASA